jgi:hypothetical protein
LQVAVTAPSCSSHVRPTPTEQSVIVGVMHAQVACEPHAAGKAVHPDGIASTPATTAPAEST